MPKIWFVVPDELRHLWKPILSITALRKERGGKDFSSKKQGKEINKERKGNYLMERKEDERARVFSAGPSERPRGNGLEWQFSTMESARFCTWEGLTLDVQTDWGVRCWEAVPQKKIWGSWSMQSWILCQQGPCRQEGHPCPGAHQEQLHPGHPATADPAWMRRVSVVLGMCGQDDFQSSLPHCPLRYCDSMSWSLLVLKNSMIQILI